MVSFPAFASTNKGSNGTPSFGNLSFKSACIGHDAYCVTLATAFSRDISVGVAQYRSKSALVPAVDSIRPAPSSLVEQTVTDQSILADTFCIAERQATVMPIPPAPCSVWREVPLDVFQQVIPYLDLQEMWQMKGVCTSWSFSVRQAAVLRGSRLQVLLSKQNLATKILQLHKWRSSGDSFDMNVCFWLAKPLPPAELLSQVENLFRQRLPGLPRCDLEVWMPILPECQTDMQCLLCVQDIVHIAKALLMRHGFQLCIRMTEPAVSGQGVVPTPEVICSLSNFLKYFDFGSVSLWQDPSCSAVPIHESPITIQHLEALLQCDLVHLTGRLATPIDGVHLIRRRAWQPLSGLTGLTTLYLTFQAETLLDKDFALLASLTCLQDLALQTVHHDACCDKLLLSNFSTLRCVILTAKSWTDETYHVLAQMPWLDSLTISIEMLVTDHQTSLFRCISPQLFRANLHSMCVMKLLMNGVWQCDEVLIHDLTVCGDIDFNMWLHHLRQLHSLTIIDCPSNPGRIEVPLSNLTSLEFVGRFVVQQSQALLHMLKTDMPYIKRLSFIASLQDYKETLPMTTEALNACSFGRHLELIDLRGVNGLTTDNVSYLASKIRKQQKLGKARPEVQILLPCTTLSKAEPMVKTCYASSFRKLLLPLFQKVTISEDNKLVVKK